MTPEERTLRARLAAHTLHALHDSSEITKPARVAFLKSFEDRVDPEGMLSAEERQRRAHHLMRAHMGRLALKSAKARRRSN